MKVFAQTASAGTVHYPAERCTFVLNKVAATSQGVAPASAGSTTVAETAPSNIFFYTGATSATNTAVTVRLDIANTTVSYGYIGKSGRYVRESGEQVTA